MPYVWHEHIKLSLVTNNICPHPFCAHSTEFTIDILFNLVANGQPQHIMYGEGMCSSLEWICNVYGKYFLYRLRSLIYIYSHCVWCTRTVSHRAVRFTIADKLLFLIILYYICMYAQSLHTSSSQ